jgi:membrane-anchored protein YejM (alkaline phosphatase superfamily)
LHKPKGNNKKLRPNKQWAYLRITSKRTFSTIQELLHLLLQLSIVWVRLLGPFKVFFPKITEALHLLDKSAQPRWKYCLGPCWWSLLIKYDRQLSYKKRRNWQT